MSYKIEFDKRAEKELFNLEKSTRTFILKALKEFELNFNHEYEKELIKTSKIKHLKGELKGLFRLRLRSFRVIYEKIDDKLIIYVLKVTDRKDAY
ncbi:putative toxin-antitoxin system, toxin component, RelE/ParE family [Campylobacter pinnipediorum subsp. caledonicus]|uniref:Putative toxin-antitoxin system, toxin component, RelE/ParE family n=1 Tax=Campylobacter pinnipediorum subsp. caledonicus TaxID=1874362 RepID=A0A1S6U646_9BACT|nr:type II toxin-antitoxin system RelE/ParE family toxin [Campylobacter pinnipediorum]AQW85577.1 putative toxin-antitoxin system, toxin component, RelE/ParE family [Campylobacter pinnipediorum subsp. caledonicus]AQW87183.1 putative toxin-antitoxin system, toxin component, RelE/ParE family [Campylobacter pinnipediorum subsp. caledonicus]OPA71858.1 hypothetical protein BB381_06900 [Campylobacter pinnipediorum subsp. caledonicus]